MRVRVLVPGVLRADAGGAGSLDVDLTAPATLADLFAVLLERQPRLERRIRDERGELRRYVNVFVDGRDVRDTGMLATPLAGGAEVQLLPSVAGG